MNIKIWNNSSFGLFNLKAPPNEIEEYDYCFDQSRTFIGSKSDYNIYFVRNDSNIESIENHSVFNINYNAKSPILSTIVTFPHPDRFENLWTQIHPNPISKQYPLKVGTLIRFGKQIVQISRIEFNQNQLQAKIQPKTLKPDIKNQNSTLKHGSHSIIACRICLEPETIDNPFESDFCACSKSMPAHIDCLISWVESKCVKKLALGSIFVDYSTFSCDICKQQYPTTIIKKGVKTELLNPYSPIEGGFITFDFFEIDSKKVKNSLILNLKDRNNTFIKIGRSKECEINLLDISVSREHAKFWWIDNQLFLTDTKSKFGTSIAFKDNFVTSIQSKKINCLIDKYLISFELVENESFCEQKKKHEHFLKNPLVDKSIIFNPQSDFYQKNDIHAENEQINDFLDVFPKTPVKNNNNHALGRETGAINLPFCVNNCDIPEETQRFKPSKSRESKKSLIKSKSRASKGKENIKCNLTNNFDDFSPNDSLKELQIPQSRFKMESNLKRINRLLEAQSGSLEIVLDDKKSETQFLGESSLFEIKKIEGFESEARESSVDLKTNRVESQFSMIFEQNRSFNECYKFN